MAGSFDGALFLSFGIWVQGCGGRQGGLCIISLSLLRMNEFMSFAVICEKLWTKFRRVGLDGTMRYLVFPPVLDGLDTKLRCQNPGPHIYLNTSPNFNQISITGS